MTLGVANFDPRGMLSTILVEDHQTLLHTKYLSSRPQFYFTNILLFSLSVAIATRVLHGIYFFKHFTRAQPKEQPCDVSLKLAKLFRCRCCF